MVEFGNSSLVAIHTASEEASVFSSGEQMTLLPQPVATADKKKRSLPGMPDPDAEVISLSPKSLLASNRFICEICSKGFQRDQNLQLHRRGHNMPWKLRQRPGNEVRKRVYVCPEPGCVHHDPKRALGDLTGIKKHFCRKHGEKKWKCERCSKKYAVQSDWKAHMKTCGTKEYRCDCGTLFSRRDSFITHRAFCDALAQEGARSAQTLAIANSDGNPKDDTVAASSSCSPPPPPLTPSSGVLSPVLSIQSSDAPENHPAGRVQQQPVVAALNTTTTTVVGSSTTSGNTTSSNGGAFASIFASAAASGLAQSYQSPSSYSDMRCAMAGSEQYRTEQPMSLSISSSLYLSNPASSSLFPTTSHVHDHQHHSHQPPALSATALLQKAAQMGATGSGSSFLRGLGLDLPSPENRTTTSTAVTATSSHQWSRHEKTQGNSMTSRLRLGLPSDGPDLMMGPSSIYGNKPTTLDLFGLGVGGDGGTSTTGFSELFTSMGGGGGLAAAVFGGVNPNEESWEGPSERKPSVL